MKIGPLVIIVIILFSGCATNIKSNNNQTTFSNGNIPSINESIINQSIKNNKTIGEKYCDVPSDCVPAQCCHPTYLVNKIYAPNCSGCGGGGVCIGPLECASWVPICKNQTCEVKYDWDTYDEVNYTNISCKMDNDCVKTCLGCCACGKGYDVYNTKFIFEHGINPRGNCSGSMLGGCGGPNNPTYPICDEGTCKLITIAECNFDKDCIASKDYGCVNKLKCEMLNDCTNDGIWDCSMCYAGLCTDNKLIRG